MRLQPQPDLSPRRLSIEKVEDSPYTPLDHIGLLTMRNLDISETRAKQGVYAEAGLLSAGDGTDMLRLKP